MRTDRAVTRLSSEPVAMRPIMDRQTPVEALSSLAVGNNKTSQFTVTNDIMNDKMDHNIVNEIEQLCYRNACLLHVSTDIKYVYVPARLAISCKAIVFP